MPFFYVERVAVLTMTWSYVRIAVIVYLLIIEPEPEPEPESFPPWRQRDNILALKVYFSLYEWFCKLKLVHWSHRKRIFTFVKVFLLSLLTNVFNAEKVSTCSS